MSNDCENGHGKIRQSYTPSAGLIEGEDAMVRSPIAHGITLHKEGRESPDTEKELSPASYGFTHLRPVTW